MAQPQSSTLLLPQPNTDTILRPLVEQEAPFQNTYKPGKNRNMFKNPVGLGTKYRSAGEGKQ
jgi:hypothetical protein